MKKLEEQIHVALCKYIQLQYPDVIFTTESSGLRLSMRAAVVAKQCRNPKTGWCDIIVLEPRGKWHGLLIEVKKNRECVYDKKGNRRKDAHNEEQREFMEKALSKGYFFDYAFGFDDGKKAIDYYMSQPCIQLN